MGFFTVIGVLLVAVIGLGLLFYFGIPALIFSIIAAVLFFAVKGCAASMVVLPLIELLEKLL